MAERVLVDNDVVLKVATWRLEDEFLATTTLREIPPAMLGVGRFVVQGRLAKGPILDRAGATAAFENLLAAMLLVEPDDHELALAADFEATATEFNLDLDGGESQLLAILLRRSCLLLITGDKRAIVAMAAVAPEEARKRVACLEQLIAEIVARHDVELIRARVCSEPCADKAVTACLACSSPVIGREDVLFGLASYAGHLAKSAPGMLVAAADLNSILEHG